MYPETVWCGGKDSVAPQTRQHVPAATPDLSPKKPGLLRKRRDSMSSISPKTVAAAAVEKIIGGGLRGHSRSASDGPVPHPVYPSQPYYPTGQESESYKKQLRRRSAFEPAEPTVPRQVREPSRGRARSRSMSRVERGDSSAATEDRRLSSFFTSSASAYTGAQALTRQAAHTGSTISASRQRIHLSSESRGALDYSNPPTGSGLSLPRSHSRRSPSHLIPGPAGGSPTSTGTGSTSQGWGIAYSNGSMLPPYAQNTYPNSSSGSARWRPRSRSLSRDGHSRSRSVSGTSSRLCYTSEACREAERLVRVHEGRW
ncbi:hypothetical protein Tdes44962_MAKER09956 [Teratosphaeria destructans]|uniref:Uncharacterized protein n=1 Tax=Teratosphaeria destructans TaxID=418781 RepID=A0A9W7SR61_9PEZI|nr:hypothetical protein Tdes44962_MAKER09956 [Teratosphaeria destructans]